MKVKRWIEKLEKIMIRLLNDIDIDIRYKKKRIKKRIKLNYEIGIIE